MHRMLSAALFAASVIAAGPASAQYGYGYRAAPDYDDDDDGPPAYARPLPPRDYYGAPRHGYGYGGPGYGRVQIGRVCVTARGNCPAAPAPFGSSCGCPIPGFGFKRGAVAY
jgi:hypothetical protein